MATVKLEGFSELERELAKLTKSAGKGVLRRSLKIAATPMKDLMQDLAPRGDTATDELADSVTIGSKLSKRQAGLHRKMFRDDRAAVEMFVGPGPDPAAWNQEFGNVNHGAQPFARPAFDAEVKPTLDRLGRHLWDEFEKSRKRAARKAAKG
ncbi:Bacteriophage HK97-gp10, putative tail-component [Yoonia tamlensis]|uniref:Bacteriophage HK97-gp10, putative tail-component n=1 Tax=Yoonia tamlensis TaxID=390270 RepID=A0A1I6GE81_9RHOB|nr:HK97 gp10 family phage protein [Yoonia tamlensis]SFR40505.1 Bacteriophage HK97-gp10, putative tail-component [Yoonia tamlensis]